MPEPLVLGFDTSAAHCAAALLCGDRIVAAQAEEMGRGQAERLMGLVEDVLYAGGARWSDLARIGVGIGPGNFTGTRISVAAARGLSLALEVPALGVSALEAAAFGTLRPCVATAAARGGQFYLQRFGLEEAEDPQICCLDSLPPIPQAATVVGPEARAIAERIGGRVAPPVHPLAEAIARIAARRAPKPGERPTPLYLRPPGASPPREGAPRILS